MKPLTHTAFAALFALSSQANLAYADPLDPNKLYEKFGQTTAEKKIIKESWDAACNFSGLCKTPESKNGYKQIKTYILNSMMFIELNCSDRPSACMRMASAYNSDYKSVFIQDNARPDKSTEFQSVLVHEFVHAQQEKFSGGFSNVNATCYNLFNAESAAYNAQNAFLRSKGKKGEEGKIFLTNFQCDSPDFPRLFVANNEYTKR